MIKTVTLSGEEIKVNDLEGINAVVHNLGDSAIYASKYPHIKPGADNVAEIPAGGAKLISTTKGIVYLLGTGKVELTGQDFEIMNIIPSPSTPIVYANGASDVAKEYVDEQDALNLKSAKDYTNEQMGAVNNIMTDLQRNKVDKSEISNPNLLDNWYFVDPINQRGETEYTATGYTIDRWCTDGNKIISLTNNGIVLQKTVESGWLNFIQRIENVKDFEGKQVIFSVLMKGDAAILIGVNNSYPSNAEAKYNKSDVGLVEVHYTFPDTITSDTVSFIIQAQDTETPCTIIAAKVEFGDSQTLAHQDDSGNWVLNDPPPNKALELSKCQRYQVVFDIFSHFRSIVVSTNYIDFIIPLPTTLRDTPSITGSFGILEYGTIQSTSDWTLSSAVYTPGSLRLRATKANHGLNDGILGIIWGEKFIIDANL